MELAVTVLLWMVVGTFGAAVLALVITAIVAIIDNLRR